MNKKNKKNIKSNSYLFLNYKYNHIFWFILKINLKCSLYYKLKAKLYKLIKFKQ